ncbi:unnamed protein product [Polarella glacialis]|uniref:Uncharacterized protein n=1 Tax=Polarella glacialis TaxID=89957 RepID=A0A813K7P2_POLGL|nr:unnamed protein product [Polarella glacialis]
MMSIVLDDLQFTEFSDVDAAKRTYLEGTAERGQLQLKHMLHKTVGNTKLSDLNRLVDRRQQKLLSPCERGHKPRWCKVQICFLVVVVVVVIVFIVVVFGVPHSLLLWSFMTALM